ncbi:MAG: hypothetical protein WDN04_26050 [Rhodospirillales bacterium]
MIYERGKPEADIELMIEAELCAQCTDGGPLPTTNGRASGG